MFSSRSEERSTLQHRTVAQMTMQTFARIEHAPVRTTELITIYIWSVPKWRTTNEGSGTLTDDNVPQECKPRMVVPKWVSAGHQPARETLQHWAQDSKHNQPRTHAAFTTCSCMGLMSAKPDFAMRQAGFAAVPVWWAPSRGYTRWNKGQWRGQANFPYTHPQHNPTWKVFVARDHKLWGGVRTGPRLSFLLAEFQNQTMTGVLCMMAVCQTEGCPNGQKQMQIAILEFSSCLELGSGIHWDEVWFEKSICAAGTGSNPFLFKKTKTKWWMGASCAQTKHGEMGK